MDMEGNYNANFCSHPKLDCRNYLLYSCGFHRFSGRPTLPKSGGEMTQEQDTPLIPLEQAYLCQDCSCVGNNARRCMACASQVVLSLAGVLNRPATVVQIAKPKISRRTKNSS